MHQLTTPDTSTVDRAARRWLGVAVGSALALVAVYLLAVWTRAGQRFENAALRGADEAGSPALTQADEGLGDITVTSLAVAIALVLLIGLLRKRGDLALAAAGVIVAGQVVTQVLKRFVLPRPALVPVDGDYGHNSLPSGHTTIAMTVLFAVLIVVPHRWRGVALFFLLSWAVAIGAYTVTAKWHRLSDTLAADAIALGLACAASWWLARRGAVAPHTGPRRVPRVLIIGFTAGVGVLSLVLGVLLFALAVANEGVRATLDGNPYVVYLAANSFASAGSIAAALVFLWTWRRLEVP
ncbi:phosphatase PAP2 family protein [Actinokineospora bangkokensis]|uniref:Phosphoesterase PA-phosphatase n=1 Tax=Actinokineospora bangkokensis TaxID=1193682 RepID=A0A1Q9LNH0_9PSEU|nr:phosphatase PAP2 family protein [Actinokineospora bangkokensis]OLR93561.1 phosphoesterase PA-phosphatase [Actinokineospora bangkokensis]